MQRFRQITWREKKMFSYSTNCYEMANKRMVLYPRILRHVCALSLTCRTEWSQSIVVRNFRILLIKGAGRCQLWRKTASKLRIFNLKDQRGFCLCNSQKEKIRFYEILTNFIMYRYLVFSRGKKLMLTSAKRVWKILISQVVLSLTLAALFMSV